MGQSFSLHHSPALHTLDLGTEENGFSLRPHFLRGTLMTPEYKTKFSGRNRIKLIKQAQSLPWGTSLYSVRDEACSTCEWPVFWTEVDIIAAPGINRCGGFFLAGGLSGKVTLKLTASLS